MQHICYTTLVLSLTLLVLNIPTLSAQNLAHTIKVNDFQQQYPHIYPQQNKKLSVPPISKEKSLQTNRTLPSKSKAQHIIPNTHYADTHNAFFCRTERKVARKLGGHKIIFRLR